MPSLIENLSEKVIDIEFKKKRFTKSSENLKKAYTSYNDGLQDILNTFASQVSDKFRTFHQNWKIAFKLPNKTDTLRNIISDDVELLINGRGSEIVANKGSGLQRLATILLHFEIIKRFKNKEATFIVLIDEPEVFIHEGLQKKLKTFLNTITEHTNTQVLYTTHSKVFISTYNMKNVFLFDSDNEVKYSARKNKDIDVVKTKCIDLSTQDGYMKICNHLGIENDIEEILKPHNLLVEGECDKIYFTELSKYFNLGEVSTISLNGASNAKSFLQFYESMYNRRSVMYKPKIKVILDNDAAGREAFNQIKLDKFKHIDVFPQLLPNHLGEVLDNKSNNEIEDFVYPEVICLLINKLLQQKTMGLLKTNKVISQISNASHRDKGILYICEYEKNTLNKGKGNPILLSSIIAKSGIASKFKIETNSELISMIDECDKRYPEVRKFMKTLYDFE